MYKQFSIVLILLKFIFLSSGSVSWKVANKPTRFGGDLELQCYLDNSTSLSRSRQWSGGTLSNILVMNGNSSDPTKYSEEFDRTKRISVLKISAFDINDLYVKYTCQHGFSWKTNWLNISIEDFGNKHTPHNSEKDQIAGIVGHIVFSLMSIWYVVLLPLLFVAIWVFKKKGRLFWCIK